MGRLLTCILRGGMLVNGVTHEASVQFSHTIMSSSFRPHGLQQARLPYPSPTLGTCSNSCPLSQWCHSTISSSVVPFSSCLQSFSASGSILMSQLFTSRGQSIGASASASVLVWISGLISFRTDWFDLLAVQGTLKSLLENEFFSAQLSLLSNSHIHTWLMEKP